MGMLPSGHYWKYYTGTFSSMPSHCNSFENWIHLDWHVPDLLMHCSDLTKWWGTIFVSNSHQQDKPYWCQRNEGLTLSLSVFLLCYISDHGIFGVSLQTLLDHDQKKHGSGIKVPLIVSKVRTGQHWLRLWLGAWWHQAITWTNVGGSWAKYLEKLNFLINWLVD